MVSSLEEESTEMDKQVGAQAEELMETLLQHMTSGLAELETQLQGLVEGLQRVEKSVESERVRVQAAVEKTEKHVAEAVEGVVQRLREANKGMAEVDSGGKGDKGS